MYVETGRPFIPLRGTRALKNSVITVKGENSYGAYDRGRICGKHTEAET